MIDYHAGYFSYWRSVVFFSVDMYETGEVGPLDSNTGRKCRQTILVKGDTVDAFDMLRIFLGMRSKSRSFFKSKGVL